MIKQNIVGALREQSDWEQQDENRLGFIKNKPFYDNRKFEEITFELDPEKPYEYYTEPMGTGRVQYLKLSDNYETDPSIFLGGTIKISQAENGVKGEPQIIELTSDLVMDGQEMTEGQLKAIVLGGEIGAFVVYEESIMSDNTTFSPGTWVTAYYPTSTAGTYIVCDKLTYTKTVGGELKTIDPKFLPSGVGGGLPLLIYAEPQGPVNIVGEAKNMTYSDVVKAINEGTLYGAFCNWMGNSLVPCSVDIGLATNAEQSYICIELVETTHGPIIVLYWTPDGTISDEHPYPAQE